MKAARAGHLCTVQFLISKGELSMSCQIKQIKLNYLFPFFYHVALVLYIKTLWDKMSERQR